MNRLTSAFVLLAIGLLLGFFAARFWPDKKEPAPLPEKIFRPARTSHGETAPAARMHHTDSNRPVTIIADTGSVTTAAPAAPAHASATLLRTPPPDDDTVRIPRRFFARIQCPVFNVASNCVTDDIVELLGISPEERERLDRLIVTTRTRVEEHEIERATVTEQSPTRVVLKIAANADAGRDTEDAFMAAVQATLGDRAASFLERAQPYESMLFSNFGRNGTTLTVTRDENSSLLRVQSQQEYITASGGHGSISSTTLSNQMPDRWKKFFQTP